jgi:hypothetical protein
MADTCIALRKKWLMYYIALSHWSVDVMGIVADRLQVKKCFQVHCHVHLKTGGHVLTLKNGRAVKVVKMYNGSHHCVSLIEMIKKHIWNVQFGDRMKELCPWKVAPMRK